eukprot:3190143-Amphidinium_carterae.1
MFWLAQSKPPSQVNQETETSKESKRSVQARVCMIPCSFGSIDRRAALEARVVLDAMRSSGASVRWIPHERNLVDGLTKVRGNVWGLVRTIETGSYECESERSMATRVDSGQLQQGQ